MHNNCHVELSRKHFEKPSGHVDIPYCIVDIIGGSSETISHLLDARGLLEVVKELLQSLAAEAPEGVGEAGERDDGRALPHEGVLGGGQRLEGLGVHAHLGQVALHAALLEVDGAEEVVEDVVGRDGGQLPPNDIQHDELPLLQVISWEIIDGI